MDKEHCIEKGRDAEGFYSLIKTPNSDKPLKFKDLGTPSRSLNIPPIVKDTQTYVQFEPRRRQPTVEEIVRQFFIDRPPNSSSQARNEI